MVVLPQPGAGCLGRAPAVAEWARMALWTSSSEGMCLLHVRGCGLYFKQECVVCQTKMTQFQEYVWLLKAGTAEKPTLVLDEIQSRPT